MLFFCYHSPSRRQALYRVKPAEPIKQSRFAQAHPVQQEVTKNFVHAIMLKRQI
jgi:hypothetical protein